MTVLKATAKAQRARRAVKEKDMKRITFRIIATVSITALLATGCVVGPNFKAPKVAVPTEWNGVGSASSDNASIPTADAARLSEWWKSFKDPELDSIITQALQSNPGLRQAQSRILQARQARLIAASGLLPSANVSTSNTTSNSSGSSLSAGGSTRNLFQAGLDAAWELDFFGGIRRGIEAAEADTQAAIEDSRDVMVSLTAETALNYMELRGFQQQIAIAKKNLEAQQKSAEITQKRFDVGFAGKLDVANADAQVATTQSQIPLLESSAQQTIYNLSVLLGREPAALLSELSPQGDIPGTPPVVPVGLPSDLLERRPDIRSSLAQLHSATAQIGVATAELFPKFSLTGTGGQQNLSMGSLGSLASRFWSFGPSISLPIFSGGRIRANIQLQTAAQQEAALGYEQTVLTALKDVESALVAYNKEQQHRSALQAAVRSSQQAVDLSMQLYTAGQGDFLNVLTAQRDLYASEDALVQSNRNVDANLIALYKALGGGWQNGTQP